MLASSPFDILAEGYDKSFTQSRIGQLQRQRVWDLLAPLLHSYNHPCNILEINCGTGEDAVQLAKMGHHVIATDASDMMIEKSKQKLTLLNSSNLKFLKSDFSQLAQDITYKKFDLVFSNFGGVNCANETVIAQLRNNLYNMMRPGAYLFLVVLNRFCLWETGYYISKGKFGTAFRRFRKNNFFEVEGSSMPVFYYSVGHLKNLFHPGFSFCAACPVGLFIPPSYLEHVFSKKTNWLEKLNHGEQMFGKYAIGARMADHFCLILKKDGEI